MEFGFSVPKRYKHGWSLDVSEFDSFNMWLKQKSGIFPDPAPLSRNYFTYTELCEDQMLAETINIVVPSSNGTPW